MSIKVSIYYKKSVFSLIKYGENPVENEWGFEYDCAFICARGLRI